ncbi:hypothetical protein NQ176_g10691 [Zarea fungicola]|uniref:Uncharacterized protein n=1 Tax=Zarea fungicola TaxID=93591 RepID=A0ACC1MG82_9HYPO|nr:hypothetical protein NQ176_g10691 [Lecanicillium fungicola]
MVLSNILELLLSSCSQIRKLGVKLFPSQNEVHGRKPNVVEWAFSGTYDPDTVVLIDASNTERTLSKREVVQLVTRLAGAFKPESVVCLHLPNDILYPVLVLAILASGCQWTGPNTSYKPYELDHHLRSSRATYVVTSAEHLESMEKVTASLDADVEIILFSDILKHSIEPKLQNLGYRTLHDLAKLHIPINTLTPLNQRLERVHPQAPATLMSTSGTTGFPKMADRSHEALVTESASDEQYDANQSYAIRRLFWISYIFHEAL